MPKVKGPLLSLGATGSLGEALIFQSQRNRPVVKRFAKPTNPDSLAQRANRARTSFLSKLWSNLSGIEKNSWAAIAESESTGAYANFLRFNLSSFSHELAPSRAYPPVRAQTLLTIASVIALNGVGFADIRTTELQYGQSLATLVHRSVVSGFTPTMRNAVIIDLCDAVSVIYKRHTDKNLQPGTYYYRATMISNDGNWLQTNPTERQATVT